MSQLVLYDANLFNGVRPKLDEHKQCKVNYLICHVQQGIKGHERDKVYTMNIALELDNSDGRIGVVLCPFCPIGVLRLDLCPDGLIHVPKS